MTDESNQFERELTRIVEVIQRARTEKAHPIVVAVDGGSGSGKSSLAARIAEAMEVALIPLDDFFAAGIPDHRWDEFTVPEQLERVFEWERVRRQALEPLLRGEPARWHAFDFIAGMRPDGTYGMEEEAKTRQPADVILLEGAYSTSDKLVELVDLTILVDVPAAVRFERTFDRDQAAFSETWHARWDPLEAYYFGEKRPAA